MCTSMMAQTANVTTDKRFVRGATMAFGRMTVSGISNSQIKEQGFCYAIDKAEPTVDDSRTTEYLNNNGRIYWLKELTPCKKYFMRAYVIGADGTVSYGDVVKFYTIPKGNITWNFHNKGDAETEKRITNAVNAACDYFNNMTSVVKTFDVTYSAGTPTADCNYQAQPWMNVGSNTSYQRCGTIMHEMEHGLGVIPYSTQWYYQVLRENVDGSGRGTGHWLGDRVTEALSFWDNVAFEQLNGDYQHMWPYGINGAHEDTGAETLYLGNAMLCQALGEDGLEHTNNHFADPYYAIDVEEGVKYYLKNEDESRGFYTSYLVEQPNGSLAWKEVAIDQLPSTDEAAWYVTFTPDNQFYQFRNAATGHYLSLAGQTANTATSLSGNTDFHLMKARVDAVDTHTEAPNPRGYWLLHHAARNPRGLSAAANGAVATEVLNLRNTSTTQRWLILTAEQAADVDRVGLSAFKAEINDILSQLYELRDVPHTEDEEGTDQALNDAISEIEAGASDAKSAVEVAALMEKARQAEFNFLANATPSDIEHPFNVSLLISNPGMDDSKGWSSAPTMNYSCAEFYEVTFDFNQTIENLPAGTYMLCAQGFQRPGKVEIAYQNRNSTTRVNAYLYAGTKSTRLKNICVEGLDEALGQGNESSVGDPVMYVPNDMKSAAAYFAQGLYQNKVVTSVTTDGASLKLGIRCKSASSYFWTCFDNFQLYYYGSHSIEEVTPVETVDAAEQAPAAVYDLYGRQLSTGSLANGQLPKGIYIVGGKKVVVR